MDASSVTQEQVNIVVNEFGKIYIDSVKETFGTITKSNNRKKKRNTKIKKTCLPSFILFGKRFEKRIFFSEIDQSETRNTCGFHVCKRIGIKCAFF